MTQKPDCIFCKIISGDIPSEVILRDDSSLAFMDTGPVAHGHVLLVPLEHYATVDQMPAETAGAVLANLPSLVNAVGQATECEGVNILQNNGAAAGQVVGHVHFHIIPRNDGDRFRFNWPAGVYEEGQMKQLADRIRGGL